MCFFFVLGTYLLRWWRELKWWIWKSKMQVQEFCKLLNRRGILSILLIIPITSRFAFYHWCICLFYIYIFFFICLLLSEVRGTFQFILLLRNSAEIKRRVCRLLLLFFVYKVFIKLMVKICSLKKVQHYFKNCFPLFLALFSTSLNIFLNC